MEITLCRYIEFFFILFVWWQSIPLGRDNLVCLTSPLNHLEHILSPICRGVSLGYIMRYKVGRWRGKYLCNFVRYCYYNTGSIFYCYIFYQARLQHFSTSRFLVTFSNHLCCGWIYHKGQICTVDSSSFYFWQASTLFIGVMSFSFTHTIGPWISM